MRNGRLTLMKRQAHAPKEAGSRREREGAAVGIDECVNSEAVGAARIAIS